MRGAETVLAWVTGATMLVALTYIFLIVPPEREMGDVQRIFYFHVPAAFATYLCFGLVAASSVAVLWKRSKFADQLALASAEVGVLFCTLVMVTGPIWARPIWGVWWTWDPRLTMTVILWAIYVGYLMLRSFGGEGEAVSRYAAVLGIIGIIDIPIIRVSVRLLEGIHPAVLTTKQGTPGLVDPTMRTTFLISSIAMLLLALWLVVLRTRTERLSNELSVLRREIERREGAAA